MRLVQPQYCQSSCSRIVPKYGMQPPSWMFVPGGQSLDNLWASDNSNPIETTPYSGSTPSMTD